MMPKARRKEALRKRASQYADRTRDNADGGYMNPAHVMNAYEDGYRAAMRDARAAWGEEDSQTMSVINLLEFLRPLR